MMPTFRFVTLPPGLLLPCNGRRTVSAAMPQVKGRNGKRNGFSICPGDGRRSVSRPAFAAMNPKTAHKKAEIEDHPEIVQAVLARII
jgi:hypothetical protein